MTKSDCLDYRRKAFGERDGIESKLCVYLLLLNVGDFCWFYVVQSMQLANNFFFSSNCNHAKK